jgi:hypothetical protein
MIVKTRIHHMRVVYLGGSFVSDGVPRDAVNMVWEAGFIPLTPAFLEPPKLYSKELLRIACSELIIRSDFVVMLPGWENYDFAQWEYRQAKESGITTFLRIRELFRLEVA